ncbi:hypothetical protein [Albimonas pacifica]|uniref:hypothetical protein n=1 Tax=Albimonas pacifica TaxID=1114924 RepID=UPI0011600BA4
MSRTTNKVSPEARDRAVRLAPDSEAERSSRWVAIVAIAPKTGYADRRRRPRPTRQGLLVRMCGVENGASCRDRDGPGSGATHDGA